MSKYFGQRVPRNEDARLLTGEATFIDDVELPGMLHVVFYRSDYAHAVLRHIDLRNVGERDDVIAVYTASELGEYWQPGPLLVPPPPIEGLVFNEATQVPLVRDKVRHAGEPVVAVVATSRYAAEDAVDEIFVDFDRGDPSRHVDQVLRERAPAWTDLEDGRLGLDLQSIDDPSHRTAIDEEILAQAPCRSG